jgi:hypothetical protein
MAFKVRRDFEDLPVYYECSACGGVVAFGDVRCPATGCNEPFTEPTVESDLETRVDGPESDSSI